MSKIINLNIVLVGVEDSHKTDLARVYVNGLSSKKVEQTDFVRDIKLLGHDVRMNILDLSITDLNEEILKKVQGIIITFDISKPGSVDELKKIYNEKKSLINGKIVLAVAANNGHLRSSDFSGPLVPNEQYKQIESDFKCTVFETSAETGENVENVFNFVGGKILQIQHLDKSNVEDIKECLIE